MINKDIMANMRIVPLVIDIDILNSEDTIWIKQNILHV